MAISLPMPRDAPVTNAVRFRRDKLAPGIPPSPYSLAELWKVGNEKVVGQFAGAAVSDRRKLLINKIRRSETASPAAKMYHYQREAIG